MDKRVDMPKHVSHSGCCDCQAREMVCANIGLESLADFHVCIDSLKIRRGETMLRRGAPSSSIYCIRSGLVKLVRYSNTGSQRIARVVRPGGVVGMEALFSDSFELTAIAMEEVLACRIPAAGLRWMMDANPSLQRRLHEHAHHALREAWAWMSELTGNDTSTRERMARLLLRLRDGDSDRIQRFSLEDIGAILGIAVETTCRILSEFRSQGLLTQRLGRNAGATAGRYYHADISGLQKIAEGFDTQKVGGGDRRTRVAECVL